MYFNDSNVLKKSFNLTEDDFYKRDHDKLNSVDLIVVTSKKT